jgi:hypothetical protein
LLGKTTASVRVDARAEGVDGSETPFAACSVLDSVAAVLKQAPMLFSGSATLTFYRFQTGLPKLTSETAKNTQFN